MHDTTPKKDIPRLATLDTLRGIAVLLVLGAHQPTLVGNTGAVLFCRAWQHIGWVGVDLFFVLSGFLVSGLLFRSWREHGRLNAGRFLMRRAWKIYPAFYAMLLIVIVNGHLHGRWPGWPPIVSEMLFIQNYTLPLFFHTWSLAVEEHFYILLPLLLFCLRGKKEAPFARLPLVCGIIALLCLALRLRLAFDGVTPLSQIYRPTHLRVDSLLAGVMIAWFQQFHGPALAAFALRWRKPLLFSALILALPPAIWTIGTAWGIHTFALTGLWLSAGMLLIVMLHSEAKRGVLAWIGTYSYSIYLWHFTASMMFVPAILSGSQLGGWLEFTTYLALSVGCGLLSAWFIEMPCIRLRDRLFPRQ